jgi:hypothetical protein
MSEEDDDPDRQERDEALVATFVKARLRVPKKAYRQSLTTLWLGNGTAALAVLSFVGASLDKGGHFSNRLLWPLTFFVLGLISMGIGTGIYLFNERQVIYRMEEATSVWRLDTGSGQRPSEKAGLTLKDPRTIAALFSAVFFVVGCVCGLGELWMSN